MRRKEKEISTLKEIEEIIKKATVFRLGLSYDNIPYVVPLSFGYKDKTIFFHSAKQGKKIDILKVNNNVCFEFDIDHELEQSEKACNWGMKFKSVIGFGQAYFLKEKHEKQKALDIIMQQYTNKTFTFNNKQLDRTLVGKIDIKEITGKKSGY